MKCNLGLSHPLSHDLLPCQFHLFSFYFYLDIFPMLLNTHQSQLNVFCVAKQLSPTTREHLWTQLHRHTHSAAILRPFIGIGLDIGDYSKAISQRRLCATLPDPATSWSTDNLPSKCFILQPRKYPTTLTNKTYTNSTSISGGKQTITISISTACRMGYHKAANESGGCRLCPPNSRTHEEGSERCDCLQGFSRLPTDPEDLGCTSKKHWVGVLETEGCHPFIRLTHWINDFLSLHLNLTILMPSTDCNSSRHKWTAHSHLSHYSVHIEWCRQAHLYKGGLGPPWKMYMYQVLFLRISQNSDILELK